MDILTITEGPRAGFRFRYACKALEPAAVIGIATDLVRLEQARSSSRRPHETMDAIAERRATTTRTVKRVKRQLIDDAVLPLPERVA